MQEAQNAENCSMLKKSLFGAVAVLGLVLAGSVAGSQPASAGYACGPWNGWCRYYYLYPGWGWNYGWYGNKHHNWNKYGHKNWDNDWNHHKGKHKNKNAYKYNNWNKYH
ncbi:MAG TPA: hypothetical protein VHK26_06850 [Methyloceanibacter sp.]|nr:hypothetical protein [Methyloceanibacter sp.]